MIKDVGGKEVAGHRQTLPELQRMIPGKVHRITETAKRTTYYPDGTPAMTEETTKVYDVFFTAGMET